MPFTKTTTGRVFTFAEEMLGALSDARVGARGRPIIFLGHSLGGIVIKSVCDDDICIMS
jgi:surfactin synthase thioesterase subunit